MERARERLRSVTIAIAAVDCKNAEQGASNGEVENYVKSLREERRSLTTEILSNLGLRCAAPSSTRPSPGQYCPLVEFPRINGNTMSRYIYGSSNGDGNMTKYQDFEIAGSSLESSGFDGNYACGLRNWRRVSGRGGDLLTAPPPPPLAHIECAKAGTNISDDRVSSTYRRMKEPNYPILQLHSAVSPVMDTAHFPRITIPLSVATKATCQEIPRSGARNGWSLPEDSNTVVRHATPSPVDQPKSVSPSPDTCLLLGKSAGSMYVGISAGQAGDASSPHGEQHVPWTGNHSACDTGIKTTGSDGRKKATQLASRSTSPGANIARDKTSTQRDRTDEHDGHDTLDEPYVQGCKEMGCRRRPLYAFKIGCKAIRCPMHRVDGMVNVRHPLCQHVSCYRQPSFGVEGDQRASFCSEHRFPHMVNVSSRRCLANGCLRHPNFGYPGDRRASYCCGHKAPGMIDVVSRRCQHSGCSRRPLYAMSGQRASFCSAHKDVGMIDVVSSRCQFEEGCNRHPSFGWKHADGKARRCAHHRLEGMESVKVHRRSSAKVL